MNRTIIVGNDASVVRRILFVLSYFIRCNEVYENVEHMIPVDGYLVIEDDKEEQGTTRVTSDVQPDPLKPTGTGSDSPDMALMPEHSVPTAISSLDPKNPSSL